MLRRYFNAIIVCSGLILLCIRNSLVLIGNLKTLEQTQSVEGRCFCDESNKTSSSSSIYELHSMGCRLIFHFITEHDVLLLLVLIHERFNGTESTLCGELCTFDSTLELMYILKTVIFLLRTSVFFQISTHWLKVYVKII